MAEGSGSGDASDGEGWRESVVTSECVEELLELFAKNSYRAKSVDHRYEIINKMCLHLIARDYHVEVVDNKAGQLCGHYPSELIVLEGHQTSPPGSGDRVKVNDAVQLKELFTTARFARCRSRFVMPVLLFEDKNICRSATLSTMAELYGRSGVDWLFTGGEALGSGNETEVRRPSGGVAGLLDGMRRGGASSESEWVLLSRVRGQDVQLLRALQVELICDLMVENKKVKYGLHVCSSEKIDKFARYSDFAIASMPYPGCEFFKDYQDRGYSAHHLQFDWSQPGVDAELKLPEALERTIHLPFSQYKKWDLVLITQNYLKLLLHFLQFGNGGLLVHCISGWDRTPLFMSLLRMSLWADGRAHQSLSPMEMLYLTLAYDWLLYGHQLKERHEKGEEVLYFCFDFLSNIMSDEFSVNTREQGHSESKSHVLKSSGETTGEREASFSDSSLHHSHSTSELEDSHSHSHLSAAASLQSPECCPETESSWQSISLDDRTSGTAKSKGSFVALTASPAPNYPPPTAHRSYSEGFIRTQSSEAERSPRGRRLSEVRRLFVQTYRSTVPVVPDQPGTTSWSGLFARLTGNSFV